MVQLAISNGPKVGWFKKWSIASFDSIGRSISHFCQCTLYSRGISLSQPNFILQRSCRIFLAVRTKGAAKPKGSNTDPIMDKIPLSLGGLSLTLTSKAKCIGVYSPLHAECSFNYMLEADLLDGLCALWFWYSLKNLLITADPFH